MATAIESAPRPLLLKSRGAAEFLAISEKTLWNQTEPRGPIPCVRVSPGTIRYSVAALTKFIEEQGK